MSSFLYALGRWAFTARRLVLMLWIGALVLLIGVAGLVSSGTDNTYSIPGTESQNALDALARTFPEVSGTSAVVVVVAPEGSQATDPAFASLVEDSITTMAAIPQVSGVTSPYDSSSTGHISANSQAVLVPVQLSVAQSAVTDSTQDALQAAGTELLSTLPDGSQVSVGGQLFAQTATGISVTEMVGILVALVVLFITFGSLVAAGFPLITALLGAALSLSLIFIATRFVTITSTTPLLALMLGLAVGIDYALFIISRHQDQMKRGIAPLESAARAVATAGSAVVFAATTVIIALVGLSVAGIPFLTTMGIAAAVAVAIAVLIAMTLTPALLGFAGARVLPRRLRQPPIVTSGIPPSGADSAPALARPRGFFGGWVRASTAVPIITVVVVVGVLALATVPAASLRLALPDAGSIDKGEPARTTYDLIDEYFGPGYNGPLLVTGSIIQSTDPVGLMDDLGQEIATVPGVAAVLLSTPNTPGDTGIVQVIPVGAPDSAETKALVQTLRDMHDQFAVEYGVDLSVTGYTAAGIDISARLAGALLPFGLVVIGLSLLLLAMVFRSIVVPVTAALGYLLSVGAAFGVTSLVFESGFMAGPLNVTALGSVISFMPIILMGVLFGLAMDYEVFLVSRMREDYGRHDDAHGAVVRGFMASARVVTAAAIIMVAVFAAFIPEGDASIQPIALGLAVGVAIDAFLVRMTLIPAVLVLFGRHAWWIPGWLDRILPSFDIEGETLRRELEYADWPEPGSRIVIAAENAGVGSGAMAAVPGISMMVPQGTAVVIRGESVPEIEAALMMLAGRLAPTSGRLKVAGFVLPDRARAVRRVVAVVRLGQAQDPVLDLVEALAQGPAVVMIDGLDFVARAGTRTEIAGVLEEYWAAARRPLTLVIGCGLSSTADLLLPAACPRQSIVLTRSVELPDSMVMS